MISRLLALTAILCFVASASATITASTVALGSPLGVGTWTHDIVVTLTEGPGPGDDDWTATRMTAELTGGATFINISTYNPLPPWPTFVDMYDSYFTDPSVYPNTDAIGSVSFADPAAVIEDPQLRFAEWYDTADTGNGEFVIARLSVTSDPCVEAYLDISLQVAAANTGGQYFDYAWHILIPEPGGLALLAVVVPLLVRRR